MRLSRLESLQGTHIALCSRGLLRFDRLAKLDLSSGLSYRRGAMGGFAITTAPEISIRRRVAPPVSSTGSRVLLNTSNRTESMARVQQSRHQCIACEGAAEVAI
jgi:hypothetical protein